MALAGCTGVFVGFETLSDENLAGARKRTPRAEDYARRVRMLHDHGIQVNGSFVLGFDRDRKDVFAAHRRLDRGQPAGVRDLSHPDALSRHAAVPATGGRGPAAASGLDPVRHGPRGVPAQAHDARGTGARLRLALSAAVLPRLDLAAAARSVAGLLTYLAIAYLYKRSNRLWRCLIRHRLVHAVWRPLVELTRARHLTFRERLAAAGSPPINKQCNPLPCTAAGRRMKNNPGPS